MLKLEIKRCESCLKICFYVIYVQGVNRKVALCEECVDKRNEERKAQG